MFAVLPYIYALVYIVYRVAKTLGKYIWYVVHKVYNYFSTFLHKQTLFCRNKAEKSESEKVKTRVDMFIAKYKRLKESKPYGMVMTVVDMVTEEERTTSRETSKYISSYPANGTLEM